MNTTTDHNSIPEDSELLDLLLEDQRKNSITFQPSEYWKPYSVRIRDELWNSGLASFRRNPRIAKGYSDVLVRDPFDLMDRTAMTWRFHKLISWLPFVKSKVFSHYKRAIAASQNEAVRVRSELSRFRNADMLETHASTLASMNTMLGSPEAYFLWSDQRIALNYLEQLCVIENFRSEIGFDRAQSFLEIGGGFGSHAHLILTLYPQIEKYLYIDLPPMLYVGTQYLRAHFGDSVYTYADWSKDRPDDLNQISNRILCLPPWCLEQCTFNWDAAFSMASFQEMRSDQVLYYLDFLGKNAASEDSNLALLYYRSGNNSMSLDSLEEYFQQGMKLRRFEPEAAYTPSRFVYLVASPLIVS